MAEFSRVVMQAIRYLAAARLAAQWRTNRWAELMLIRDARSKASFAAVPSGSGSAERDSPPKMSALRQDVRGLNFQARQAVFDRL